MSSPEDPDLLIIERVKKGDVKAFEMLVVKYQRRVERLVARMLRDADLVQDVAQETFISAYRALSNFRGDSAFYTWLYRIAVNTTKKALAELQRDPARVDSSRSYIQDKNETFGPGEEPSHTETPESILCAQQLAHEVNAAMSELSEDLRQAIVLREIEGLSYEEIADIMASPIGTVRSRIFRAREAIAQRLRPLLERQQGVRW